MKGDEKLRESLQADRKACHKEYENAPKLSDEEIDRILWDVRKQARRKVRDVLDQEIEECWDEASKGTSLTDEEIDELIHNVRRENRNRNDGYENRH